MVAGISLVLEEFLFFRTKKVASQTRSSLILANGWHHRSDSLTLLITLIGISAVICLGPKRAFLDSVLGILIAGFLAGYGFRFGLQALNGFMDKAPYKDLVQDLCEHILEVPEADGYHEFRARHLGDLIEVDFHLLVDPNLSVGDGHHVAARVKRAIKAVHPEVINVLIHVVPDWPNHRKEKGISEIPGDHSGPPESK